MKDKLHSIDSAAEFLGGVSPWSIRSWISRGRLTRVKVGSRTFVRESDLLKLIRVEDVGGKTEEPLAQGA